MTLDTSVGTAENAIPGTVHLVDIEGTMRQKHAKGKHLNDVILVPTPSNDPDDPLNWSPKRKLLSTVSMCMYIMMVGLAASAVYAVLIPISESTGLSVNDLNAGTGYQYLAFGWGCVIWQPLALQFGKRPIYLISLLLTLGVTVSVPYVRSPGTWMLCKVLAGFVGAPIESLGEISVSDVYFSHQRGTYMSVYAFTLYTSGFLAPVFAGFINDGQGWEWVQYWCAIGCGVGFIFCFFFMEETNYDRPPMIATGLDSTTPTSMAQSQDGNEVVPGEKNLEAGTHHEAPVSFGTISPQEIYKPKSYWQKLSLIDKKRPFSLHWRMLRPIELFQFPVILWCGFSYGCSLIWYNVLNATASLILSGPPYNFRASMVGLSYISCLLGVILGSIYAGQFGDWVVLRLTRRNNGIWESEHRLWLFLLSAVLLPFSLILWGVGAGHGVHWFGLIFAMFLTGVVVTAGAQLAISYCIDTYKDLGADAVVSVICIRNTMSFAIGYGVTPWIVNMGYQNAFLVAAFVGMLQVLSFLPMVKWGPALRRKSVAAYRKQVERAVRLGIDHH